MEQSDRLRVRDVTNNIIQKIEHANEKSSQRAAMLAMLRNSIGKPLRYANTVWPLLFENLPEYFLSQNGEETEEEKAIYITLQIYALCKQGTSDHVVSDGAFKGSVGASLKAGKSRSEGMEPTDSRALDRRFNTMITADTFDEFVYHLIQLIKLVKSRTSMTVNFNRLAEDLFWYQKGFYQKICFNWAQDYYTPTYKNIKASEEDKNNE